MVRPRRIACMAEQQSATSPNSFTSTMREDRLFPPPPEFAARAHIRSRAEYDEMYRRSIDDNEAFWAEQAQSLDWFKPFETVLDWNVPEAKWFVGGKLNLCHNAVDRHALGSRADKNALLWEGEPGEVRSLTYAELHAEVQRFANVLKSLGITKGDRVAIYMGVCPEIVLAVLACARIGAVHNVVFGGFAAQALADRMNDAQCKLLITQDTSFRRGQDVALKSIADEALDRSPGVEHVLVYQRSGKPVTMKEGRDHWLHEELARVEAVCAAEPMDSEDPLYILYTSGTTGKPKGLVHTTGGYGVGTLLTTKYIFDLQDEDVYWCTADVGWVTGHSYVVYGPLLNGATIMLYEGAPNWPECDRFWQIVDRHKVSIFYTAPTAIRAFMKWGTEHVHKHSLASLRMLGTVGEPINPEAWMWYHREIGKERCPIADTWWQTETGSIMIAAIPGAVATKPGSATLPFFGIAPEIVTKEGEAVPLGQGGLLVIRKPWPAMARTIFGDAERYKKAYWSEIPGSYFTGDGARRDADGYFWLMGRVDDVLNISGHRLGTAEIESALVAHPMVAEAAVVGRPDEMKGEGIVVFVSLHDGAEVTTTLKDELKKHVAKEIGALARPDEIRFTPSLPKTRSGKIMRRLLRELAATGDVKGDTTTLEDFTVVAKLKEKDEE
ncbi:acetyl-coenzyme A synthetase [Terriglobus roseus]|uniref:Acetyl-coenzyme A synthetase n=2 Tax=Terriglobus roseus TaxID=392734 RepID=A0A1H4REE6_9BACT|nr:acetyl-coenzyme A synthetase [Terriglobus roseus]